MEELGAIVQQARDKLASVCGDGTYLVFVKERLQGPLVCRKARGSEPDLSEGSSTRVMMGLVEADGKPRLVLDATKEPDFQSVSEDKRLFRSALCVPVADAQSRLVGLLYCHHPEPGAFSYAHRTELQQHAEEMGRALGQVDWSPKKTAREPRTDPALLAGPLALLLLGGLWALIGAGVAGSSVPTPTPSVTVVKAESAEPQVVASSFVNLVQLKRLDSAYLLLSEGLRQQLKPEEFEQRLGSWLDEGSNAWELRQRKVHLFEPGDRRCRVEVTRAEVVPWRWTLISQADGWRLDSVEGLPLAKVE